MFFVARVAKMTMLGFLLSLTGLAAPIVGVTAITDLGDYPGYPVIQTVADGSNLSSFSAGAVTTEALGGWFSDGLGPVGTVTFDLGAQFAVNSFAFWNAGPFGLFGVQTATMEYSSDGGATFNPFTGGAFGVGGLAAFAPAPMLASTGNVAQIFNFNPFVANVIRMNTLTTYNGDSNSPGFQAIIFDGEQVPEIDPKSVGAPLMLSMGLLALSLGRRRKASSSL